MGHPGQRVPAQFQQGFHARQGTAEEEAGALARAIEIGQAGKSATLHPREQQGRSAGPVDAPLDFRHFQMGIDFLLHAAELAGAGEVIDGGLQGGIGHRGSI
jgi:hypothetical protein